jgi:hypothetical protein
MPNLSSRACISAICRTNGGTWSIRTRATVGPRNCVDYSRASANPQSTGLLPKLAGVIAAVSSLCVRRLAGSFEAQRTRLALSYRPIFSSRGLSLLTREFLPAQVLAGRVFSFLRTLVQNPQKPGRSVVHALSFSPIVYQVHLPQPAGLTGLVAASDGHRDSKRKESCPTRSGSNPTRNGAKAS